MAGKKVRNPLIKRLPREFLGEWKKYLVLAIFLITIIGMISGMFVANGSMLAAADEGIEKYKREDGYFILKEPASEELIKAIEGGEKADLKSFFEKKGEEELQETITPDMGALYDKALEKVNEEVEKELSKAEKKYELNDFDPVYGTKICENFYVDLSEDKDRKIRLYKIQDNVNLPSVFEGVLPKDDNEIAIDRMHADNAGLKVGDTVNVAGKDLKVTALIALPNYSGLYENNSDTIFDSINFGVALVTSDLFDELSAEGDVKYAYSWFYKDRPEDDKEATELSDDYLKVVITNAAVEENELEDYLPSYLNQAITFATNDFGKDLGMTTVFMYIFMAFIAFIFAVTISSTIMQESKVIGTLRASGYTRGELIRHYLLIPMIVTLVSALIANILGYTVFKDAVAAMYYNSYSLPVFEVVWSFKALYMTTLIPLGIVFVVNLIVITYKLRYSPLEFLRKDLKQTKRKNAIRLPRWSFLNRFRLRIVLQNISNYLVIALGLICIMFLMAFAVGAPDTLNMMKSNAPDMIICDYQTVLKSTTDEDDNEITTSVDSEKFALETLRIENTKINEDVSIYGISSDSKFVDMPELKKGEVMITSNLKDKYKIRDGEEFTLNAKFESTDYKFKAVEVEDKYAMMAVFMPIEDFNEVFDKEEGNFTGYFSSQKITDIDEKYIAKVMTIDDIMGLVGQFDHSMGNAMQYFQIACVILAIVLTYLLTKVIIDKSQTSISMVKVLGYKTGEIASLYIIGTTVIFLLLEVVGTFIGIGLIGLAWESILRMMAGWFEFHIDKLSILKMIVYVFVGYLVVVVLDFIRIRKVPMTEALKNVE
ncbi:MAG: ABC transporter permease [Clostridiales bacterium]|nr:ABC transporter permease [Clostridiales bacterium]